MQYRSLGPSGVQVSELSFGCGRLPEDDEESTRVIHAAIEAGCNYFETATFYCNNRCQQKAGLGLKGFTDKVMVSVKQGVDVNTTAASYRKELDRQLAVIGIDHAAWLQVGWLSLEALPHLMKPGGAWEAIEQARNEGVIEHIGFTGHDAPDNFIKILETGMFESMTVSYHLLNRAYEPTIAKARELGVGVVIMNPVGGGILGNPSTELQQLIPGGATTSTAAAALRFVLANLGVSTACSGMDTVEKVWENAVTVGAFTAPTDADHAQMAAILDQFKALGDRFCTGCNYCAPCPQDVAISQCFNLYNLFSVYGLREAARASYQGMEAEKRAANCVACGVCETKCPNHLPIMQQLAQVRDLFEQGS